MTLTKVEQDYLRRLLQDQTWQQILNQLEGRRVSRYKPAPSDETHKFNTWIYDSGRADERDFILNILTLGE